MGADNQLERQQVFNKTPDGEWKSNGYHKGFLDTTRGQVMAGGTITTAALLAWLALKGD